MLPSVEIQKSAHVMSQIVYLDVVPAMYQGGNVTVGSLASYYLHNPLGKTFLRARFGEIEREYELWKDFLKITAAPYSDWVIADILNDNAPNKSGFYGCRFIAPDGEGALAFRGSEMLGNPLYQNDYKNNLSLGYEQKTPQHKLVDRFWYKIAADSHSKGFHITGHSLGGNLALYAAFTTPERLRAKMLSCVALNAPGFNREFLKAHANDIERARLLIFALQNEYDIVSSLLQNAVEPIIISSRASPGAAPALFDIMYPHSNFMFAENPDGSFAVSESGEKSRLCDIVGLLSEMFLRLPILIRREVSAVVLDELYRAPNSEQAKRYALEAMAKCLTRHICEGEHLDCAGAAHCAAILHYSATVPKLYTEIEQMENTPATARALLILMEMLACTGKAL